MAREMFDRVEREWISPEEYYRRKNKRDGEKARSTTLAMPMIIGDIEPYQSVIDDSWITSRTHHKDHLRNHNMIEVGNEKPKPPPPPTTAEKNAQDQDVVNDIKQSARQLGVDML